MAPVIGVLLALPLLSFAFQALRSSGSFALHARAWGATLEVAGGAVLVALAVGIPVGLALSHSRRSWTRTLTLFPLLLPPVLGAAVWLGAGLRVPGAPGCAVLLGALYWPVVALLLDASLRRLPADALDAAAMQLTPARTLRVVVWPHARPALLAAALLVFLLAASEFSVPALFVVPTISMTIYEELSAFRIASAAAASLPLLALAAALAAALRRLPAIASAEAPRAFLPPRLLGAARGLAVLAWAGSAGAPALLFALRIRGFGRTMALHADAALWSVGLAGLVALLLVAWASSSPRRSRLEPLWLATLALPGVVAGLGAASLGLQPWLGSSGGLLLLALLSRFAYVAWLPLREPVDPAQIEAAELAGLSRFRIWRRILAPAILPRAAAVAAAVFALALGEIGPAVLLSPPGRQTVAQHLFNWMHYGYDDAVASLALLLFGATALVTWGGWNAGRLRPT